MTGKNSSGQDNYNVCVFFSNVNLTIPELLKKKTCFRSTLRILRTASSISITRLLISTSVPPLAKKNPYIHMFIYIYNTKKKLTIYFIYIYIYIYKNQQHPRQARRRSLQPMPGHGLRRAPPCHFSFAPFCDSVPPIRMVPRPASWSRTARFRPRHAPWDPLETR